LKPIVTLGDPVGAPVGFPVGSPIASSIGSPFRELEGASVGLLLENEVTALEGAPVGLLLGDEVKALEGLLLGDNEVDAVGEIVGAFVGAGLSLGPKVGGDLSPDPSTTNEADVGLGVLTQALSFQLNSFTRLFLPPIAIRCAPSQPTHKAINHKATIISGKPFSVIFIFFRVLFEIRSIQCSFQTFQGSCVVMMAMASSMRGQL
jgi:hypothetical protein